jgi:ATP-dependent DNA helicase RecG
VNKPTITLSTDVQYIKGVGPKLGALLSRREIHTVYDLLMYFPRAYEDRRAARSLGTLKANDVVSIRATVVKTASFQMGRSKRKIYDVLIRDQSGQIHCKFFRVPYKGYFERFSPNTEVRVIGKITDYRGRLEFHHPDLREYNPEEEITDDLVPIYPEIETLSSSKILRLIRLVLEQLPPSALGNEMFPKELLQKYELAEKKQAVFQLHKPPVDLAESFHQMKSQAHRRIIFEEFFWLELYLAAKKSGLKKEKGLQVPFKQTHQDKINQLLAGLPFKITEAQRRTFEEIKEDFAEAHPMHRLVQGDVGSGKTMVAMMAMTYLASAGYQSCLMVPTEILAEQHFKNVLKSMAPLGIRAELLTGKTKTAERKKIFADLKSGAVQILIGTHALIEDDVEFDKLGLVIIDEQHRFGVGQRGKLKAKGYNPHFLVMTATPIPRTLAMTVYGDLEVSVIDEMPKGRKPIKTRVIYESLRHEALKFMSDQIQKGRQAYIVYPLVEESEKMDLKNAMDEFEKLKNQYPEIKFGLMHGRLKSQEKEEVMESFRKGELQVLVSTTVIEVGVDVPNATLMIIEHSERFGLSQLHQLRGRVGRGEHTSFCVMIMGKAVSEEARLRTQFMQTTSDGFKVAEFDLEMRGPGEFLGTRQSGLPGFKMANLVRDVKILQEARDAAFDILKKDPYLRESDNRYLRDELLRAHGPTALAGIA